jgi:AAA+ superfamily predicted ATPase
VAPSVLSEPQSRNVPQLKIDGLWLALGRLDRMLERAAASADAAFGSGASAEPYRGLYITSEDVRRLLNRRPGEPFLAGRDGDAGETMPEGSRFPWLQRQFELTSFDLDVILIALAPEVDLRYERLFAYLQDDVTRRRPSVELALNLLCATREAKVVARGRFTPDGPLIRHKLLHVIPDSGAQPPLLAHLLKLDESIVRFLLGSGGVDGRLQAFARLDLTPTVDISAGARVAKVVGLAAENSRKPGSRMHFYFEGPDDGAKTAAAASLAVKLNVSLLTAHLGRAAAVPGEFETVLGLLFREAHLQEAVLFLEDFDSLRTPDRTFQLQTLLAGLEDATSVVILSGEQPCDPAFYTMASMVFRRMEFRERRAAWASALQKDSVRVDDRTLDELAWRYRLNDAQIQHAVESTVRQLALESATPQVNDLLNAAHGQSRRDLGSLAPKVRPVYQWSDLVLPSDQVAQLRELCRQARYRHIVLGEWGFDRKLSLGKGLSALFSGPPGTGKTMAVEVIANDLGLDLYKIDLSQVVSKYIGETEKNMDKLFSGARAGNAILFFDECDALFGKRTAVQDAHDRYANIEIAYLLQKMDEHDGVSVLATNLRQNLDAAFTRRLTFIVEFPFPDEASRRRIWEGIWPAQVPRRKDLDLEFMATQFKLPGGAVKNIAVAAAFLAAAQDKPEVTTEHLLWATRRELEKSGRSVPRTEFGRYGDRMHAIDDGGGRS